MINFNGLRGSGKTVNLVKTAKMDYKLGHSPVILTIRKDMEDIYRRAGLPNEIPVITYNDYLKNPSDYITSDIFIDEVEIFLQTICFRNGGRIVAFTSEKENVEEIRREDWDKNYNTSKEI